MIEIRLPYPPSVNHYWIRRKGSTKLCLSERARVFRSLVAVQALKFLTAHKEIRDRDPVLRGNVELWMVVCPPDNRKRDFDNLLKATLDAIVHARLIEDDCKIKKASIWMKAKDPEKQGYVDIMLDQLGDDLKLDERIYEDRRIIFNCFSAEDAKKYVGQQGYFADKVHAYQDLDKTYLWTLDRVDGDGVPFKAGSLFFPFFLPAEFVRPVEEKKEWRPFTLDEFRAKFPLLSPVTFRRKGDRDPKTFCFIGYSADRRIILGSDWYSLDALFERYELQGEDGWTPFGVEDK